MAGAKKKRTTRGVDPGGRPAKYDTKFNGQATKLARLGMTDKEMAAFFEIDGATFDRWKERYPKFRGALMAGKEISDAQVADKLYHRAMGYSHPEVDVRVVKGKIVKTALIKHYPPDTAAATLWLKNRQKGKWRDKVETGLTDGEGNDVPVVLFKLPENGRNQATGG